MILCDLSIILTFFIENYVTYFVAYHIIYGGVIHSIIYVTLKKKKKNTFMFIQLGRESETEPVKRSKSNKQPMKASKAKQSKSAPPNS